MKRAMTLEQLNKMVEDNPNGTLYLNGLTSIPEGFNPTVGGDLWLNGLGWKQRKNVKYTKLRDGDYVPGEYIYCDRILTHVSRCKKVTLDGREYTFYIGKIKGRNVLSDGVHYAHCSSLREGISDLLFKSAKDRGAEQYREKSLDDELTVEEAVTMYRIITGPVGRVPKTLSRVWVTI